MALTDLRVAAKIALKDLRLSKPTSPEVGERGLTARMWFLIMEASALVAEDRPSFDSIHVTTGELAEDWEEQVSTNTTGGMEFRID